jgi:hypothetical protein
MSATTIGSTLLNLIKTPFRANLPQRSREVILGLQQGGMQIMGGEEHSTAGLLNNIPILGSILSAVEPLIAYSSLLLLYPPLLTTLGLAAPVAGAILAGIFAANVISAVNKGAGYLLSAIGCLSDLDFGGFIQNGLSGGFCMLAALPCGALFRNARGTFNAIRGTAAGMQGGATTANYIHSGAQHLYGPEFATNLTRCGQYLRQLPGRVSTNSGVSLATA